MNSVNRSEIEAILDGVAVPYLADGLRAAGAVKGVLVEGDRAEIQIELGFPAGGYVADLRARIAAAVAARFPGVQVEASIDWHVTTHAVQRNLKPVGEIRNIIAVASAKGGVGKSTTAANLALALVADGARVGMLDADIYGPSQPRMLGLRGRQPVAHADNTMDPLPAYGLVCMSIGFLIEEEQPMVWRGPMVTQALNQLISSTRWGALDYLVVDMPPGTGDIQLTLSQRVPVSGAVIVTTPQDIALLDARKGLKMFEKVEVPVLGVVENMSTHVCSNCGHVEPIFGSGGGRAMAEQYEVPFLGSLPLDLRIREQADSGRPTVVADPDGDLARAYVDIARHTAARLAGLGKDYSRLFPSIVVEES